MHVSARKPVLCQCSADSIVNYALLFIGKPYNLGGNTIHGFDCSGFVSFVFGHFNIIVPRSSMDYDKVGVYVPIDSCMKGDLILFTGTDYNHSTIGHVGIILSERGEPIRFIHSSSSKKHLGVIVTNYDDSGYISRFIEVRRICY